MLKSQLNRPFDKSHHEDIVKDLHKIYGLSNQLLNLEKPFRIYLAEVNQEFTSAPVANEILNTLGGPVTWSRNTNGSYSVSGFNLFKGFMVPILQSIRFGWYYVEKQNDNTVWITTYSVETTGSNIITVLNDNQLSNTIFCLLIFDV